MYIHFCCEIEDFAEVSSSPAVCDTIMAINVASTAVASVTGCACPHEAYWSVTPICAGYSSIEPGSAGRIYTKCSSFKLFSHGNYIITLLSRRCEKQTSSEPSFVILFYFILFYFILFFILRRMGKNKALAHHTFTYFHSRRVSI